MLGFRQSSNTYRPGKYSFNKIDAFTLIELLIAITLITIVSGILAVIISMNFKIMNEISDRKKLVTRGMLAINLFERETGMIKDSTNIVIADDQQFKFNDKYGNTWDYSVSGTTLTRQEVGVGSAVVLATPIINADTEFIYYDDDNNVLSATPLSSTNRKLVRLIKLILVMDDGDNNISLMATVYPENMKIYNP